MPFVHQRITYIICQTKITVLSTEWKHDHHWFRWLVIFSAFSQMLVSLTLTILCACLPRERISMTRFIWLLRNHRKYKYVFTFFKIILTQGLIWHRRHRRHRMNNTLTNVCMWCYITLTGLSEWTRFICTWCRHRMETFSPLLEFPAHKGQWRGALMFSLICAWINGWVNTREAGDIRRHRTHYDVIVMNSHYAKTLRS